MNLSTIFRTLAGVLSVVLLGLTLIVGAPFLSPAAADEAPANEVCRASVKIPFDLVIDSTEAVIDATLIDPAECVKVARFDLIDVDMNTLVTTVDFHAGEHAATLVLPGPGRFRLVADTSYNLAHNATVSGLSPVIRGSNVVQARLASKVSLSRVTVQGKTYVQARARYYEPEMDRWMPLADMPLRFQKAVAGHWVRLKTVSADERGRARVRVHVERPWRVIVPNTEFIWGTSATLPPA